MLGYAEKIFDLSSLIGKVKDLRPRPQISADVIARSVLIMFLSRMGSLNSIEQLKSNRRLRDLLKAPLPSADTLGRVFNLIDANTIREIIHEIYNCLKKNKALQAPAHGLIALVIDGHESHSSYRRHCSGCLERTHRSGKKEQIEYYHRNVTAQLVFRGFSFLLDAESQQPGEGEVTCASRLLARVMAEYVRAFDVVVVDALYAKVSIFKKILKHNKEFIVVLKDNSKQIARTAKSVIAEEPPAKEFVLNQRRIQCWDFTRNWLQLRRPLRVVATRELAPPVVRQLDGAAASPPESTWMWLTSLSPEYASSEVVAEVAHSRWSIENEGFNELANHWHADHIYRHAPEAILNFWLMSMVAYNVFRAFFERNLKTALREGKTMMHFARMITAELYVYAARGKPITVPP